MRTNIYKDKIIKLLSRKHLLSIADIHKTLPEADYSTVYRNIEQLTSDKKIKKVVLDKGVVLYEINNEQNNHDHFVCNDCGSVEELERVDIDLVFLKNHNITDVLVRGVCQGCN